jgi:hypothetical protein
MKSWVLNKIVKEEDVTYVASAKVGENSPVRICVETVKTWVNRGLLSECKLKFVHMRSLHLA